MREKPQDTWQRIERFRRDLIDLCEEVTGEMDQNRRTREEWHAYTRVWKRVWLSGSGAADGKRPLDAKGPHPGPGGAANST